MSIVLIIVSGLCFVMFIMFNYAYNNPGNGLFNILQSHASNWDSGTLQTWYGVRISHIQTGFGLSGVFLFSLGILVAIIRGFGDATSQE